MAASLGPLPLLTAPPLGLPCLELVDGSTAHIDIDAPIDHLSTGATAAAALETMMMEAAVPPTTLLPMIHHESPLPLMIAASALTTPAVAIATDIAACTAVVVTVAAAAAAVEALAQAAVVACAVVHADTAVDAAIAAADPDPRVPVVPIAAEEKAATFLDSLDTQNILPVETQPVLALLSRFPIHIPPNCAYSIPALQGVAAELDELLQACQDAMTDPFPSISTRSDGGAAPGFWTRSEFSKTAAVTSNNHHAEEVKGGTWIPSAILTSYHIWQPRTACLTLPAPNVFTALRCFRMARQLVQQRLEHITFSTTATAVEEFPLSSCSHNCSCIGVWGHVQQNVTEHLINQGMEQMMCREASDVLHAILEGDALNTWNASYDNHTTTNDASSSVALQYHSHTPAQFITNRDAYMAAFCQAALNATSLIQISTCYLFKDDPAHQYIVHDLIPYLVKSKKVRIHFLMDLLVVESLILKSALHRIKNNETTTESQSQQSPHKAPPSLATSFLQHLPSEAPARSFHHTAWSTHVDFLQPLVDLHHSHPDNFCLGWWGARDAAQHYRIKSHVKCAVFDGQVAILGGSNLAPTVKSATADLDVLVAGPAARDVSASFDRLWTALHPNHHSTSKSAPLSLSSIPPLNPALTAMITERTWQDPHAQVAILPSTPSSTGDDVILRVVLDRIRTAQSEVLICMGHASFCEAMVRVIADAVNQRGVRVCLVVNSLYSNDLRNGQADLFLSVHHLLTLAPATQVYVTTMMGEEEEPEKENDTANVNLNSSLSSERVPTRRRPDFIHAKYVVVDRHWIATGSWNLWTRSAFYEIEHEAVMQSSILASALADKLEADIRAHCIRLPSAEACQPGGQFCPRGCDICAGFGPFFRPPPVH